MALYIRYPDSGSASSNASVSATNAAVPTDATLVGGKDGGGLLQPMSITAAGALKVDNSANTQPVSGTVSAKIEDTAGASITVGQKLSASSVPVVIASDQSAVPSSQSGTWNITNVSGTVSLPTNAAQETGGHLASIDGKFGSLGQKAMAGSAPVVIASDQSAIPVSGSITASNASIGSTGVAVPTSATLAGFKDGSGLLQPGNLNASGALKVDNSANTQPVSGTVTTNQGTANATPWNENIAQVGGSAITLGQKVSASSLPVVLASDQSSIATKQAPNANASGSAAAATVSTVATLTAPANAVGFILQNLDTSGANIRWAIGRTASTTLGQQLQPGRDTGFIPCGANVSICAESGTQNYDVQWISQ